MLAGTCLDAPSGKEVRNDVLEYPLGSGGPVSKPAGHCEPTCRWPGHQFSPSGKKLSRWATQLESEMKGKDQMISELRDTVYELADALIKRERHGWRCQAKSEDQVRQH